MSEVDTTTLIPDLQLTTRILKALFVSDNPPQHNTETIIRQFPIQQLTTYHKCIGS